MFKAQKGSKDIVKIVHVTLDNGLTLIVWIYEKTFCVQRKLK